MIGCPDSTPREISYSTDDHAASEGTSDNEVSQTSDDTDAPPFTIEFYPITDEQLDSVTTPKGTNDVDIWKLNFRGRESGGSSEVFLEVAYSPDSEVMYINVLYSGAESVIECETAETERFVDFVEYVRGHPDVFLDHTEFAFGIPGMFSYPDGATDTFSIVFNEDYVISKGFVPGQSRDEIGVAMDMIKNDLLDFVISGDCN